ncbi:tubulin-specific chaperone a, putative [Plasmodium gallinaceum]|uniref:Tubulin-specific chaperone A n=1 Tax=Plasmodium gallinaceum TaxID=5849 RepID=A0A1J1GLZ6_PLAGA|nr:tubulin-specific chaperone a, putative [Plasmodium gallinaceum]CRG93347.1 tubulin-specific chaperone a, putative [Plasmodium gallinaceum]
MKNLLSDFKLLKINHGAVKRLFKELIYYEKEEEELKSKVNKLKDENKHEGEIKKAEEILQETIRVLPHINTSLHKTLKKLCNIIYENFEDILEINGKKIEFSNKYSEEELKQNFATLYEEFYQEINDINQTLENVFLHIKDAEIPTCNRIDNNSLLLPKEEYVDI